MINGEKKTGITLFKMDDGIDSGPIVGQKEEAIHLSDTISTLYSRIEDRGLELLDEHLPLLVINKAKLKPQPENGRKISAAAFTEKMELLIGRKMLFQFITLSVLRLSLSGCFFKIQ